MPLDLERKFDAAMMSIYQCALSEANYRATRFHQMLCDNKGIETARILLHNQNVSDGYTALWERGRLDLTVEALILKEEWKELFTDDERQIAANRLTKYGYTLSGI